MSDTPTVLEVNCETGEVTTRPFTAEEIANREIEIAKFAEIKAAEEAAEQARLAAKGAAEQKLMSLGLTAEEIAALSK